MSGKSGEEADDEAILQRGNILGRNRLAECKSKVQQKGSQVVLGGGNSNILIFIPKIGEDSQFDSYFYKWVETTKQNMSVQKLHLKVQFEILDNFSKMSIGQVWTSKHLRLQPVLVFHIRFQAMNLRQVETFLLEQLDDAPTEVVALINLGWPGDGRAVFVQSCYPPGNQHIPPWEKENHLQNPIFGGYVSSLEGTIKNGPPSKKGSFFYRKPE